MPAEKNRKFFDLRNGLKAVDFRNKDYFDRIDEKEQSLYSPYMLMRYTSSTSSHDQFYIEHYVEMVNECVNKNMKQLDWYKNHKKLAWMLTSMCGALKQQFHPWIKPMKRSSNKSLDQLAKIYPHWHIDDIEALDKIITDKELEELLDTYGQK
jgi:hypothetical protein